jgi:hypothetical protein
MFIIVSFNIWNTASRKVNSVAVGMISAFIFQVFKKYILYITGSLKHSAGFLIPISLKASY